MMQNLSKIQNILIQSLVLLLILFTENFAQKLCIPLAKGVPGTELWEKPPNWWDSGLGYPKYDTKFDAPGWRGALAINYGGGGADPHVVFKALYNEESGQKYLYFSWHVIVAKETYPCGNAVYFGFCDADPNDTGTDYNNDVGNDIIVKIELNNEADMEAAGQYQATVWEKASNASTWNTYSDGSPTWLNETCKVWMNTTVNQKMWVVNIRIPITSSDASTTNYLDNGINVGRNSHFWYELHVAEPTDEDPNTGEILCNGHTEYKWPRTITNISKVSDVYIFPATHTDDLNLGRIEHWGEFQLSGTNCPTEGITIKCEDIGTTNPIPHQIIADGTTMNTFYASPRNQTTSPVTGISARFRIANWGSHSTWEDLSASTTLWEDIVPTVYTQPGIQIPAGNSTDPIANPGRNPIYFVWKPNPNNFQPICPVPPGDPIDPNKNRCHQCILVDLRASGNVTFLNSSVYRNIDIVSASKFSREAEINIKGLAQSPLGTDSRDVYLYIVPDNMPEYYKESFSFDKRYTKFLQTERLTSTRKRNRTEADSLLKVKQTGFNELKEYTPTFQVHSYYDTGKRINTNGRSVKILRPLTSFGYFVKHEGDLEGWLHSIENAQEIAPNYYKISVPNDSFSVITTNIESIPSKKIALSLHGGVIIPHGGIRDNYEMSYSSMVDAAYKIYPGIYIELLAGYFWFKGKDSNPDLTLAHISGSLKYIYSMTGRTQLYGSVGSGTYLFESDSTKYGFKFGGGLQYRLTHSLDLSIDYSYHSVSDTNPDFKFSTLQAVLRYRF